MYRALIFLLAASLPACAVLEDPQSMDGEPEIYAKTMENPFRTASSQELDQVGALDVGKCILLVEGTVATLGRLPQMATQLGRLGHRLRSIDLRIVDTIGGWLSRAGIAGDAANGLAWILVKAGEVAGVVTAGVFTKRVMIQLIDIAVGLVRSCSLVLQTYWDGVMSLPYVFGYEPSVDGCQSYDEFIECQEVCGVSLSKDEQLGLWYVPEACRFEPMQTAIRSAYMEGYMHYCLGRHCRGDDRYPPDTFSQCVWQGSRTARDLLGNMEERCAEVARVGRLMGR